MTADAEARARPDLLSARVALGATVALTLVFGAALDALVGAGVAVLGALAFVASTTALRSGGRDRTALGSVGLMLGSVCFVGGVAVAARAGAPVVGVLSVATFVVALEVVDGLRPAVAEVLSRTSVVTGSLFVVALVVGGVASLLVELNAPSSLSATASGLLTANHVVAFWWLQVAVLLIGALLPRAAAIVSDLEAIVRGRSSLDRVGDRFSVDPFDLPDWYVAALVGQALLGGWAPAAELVREFLAARPLVGGVVDALLLSGVLHGLLLSVVVLLLCVVAAPLAYHGVVVWAGRSPADAVAYAAGGIVAVTVALALVPLTMAGVVDLGVVPDDSFWSGVVIAESAAPVLVACLLALLAVAAVVVIARLSVDASRPTGRGFTVGSLCLFAATLLAAEAVGFVLVLLGVAASVLVWDGGVHALGLDRDLVDATPRPRSEVVHSAAVGLALAGAVAVATAVGYLLIPVSPPEAGERATLALALTMVSLLSFAFALRW